MKLTEDDKRRREAAYKERLAADIEAAGGWQADLHRKKAAELRKGVWVTPRISRELE